VTIIAAASVLKVKEKKELGLSFVSLGIHSVFSNVSRFRNVTLMCWLIPAEAHIPSVLNLSD
jgi:hypothetical protein